MGPGRIFPRLPFDDDIALRRQDDGSYAGAVAAGWETPRGPLGGYVMAIVLHGMQLAVGDDRRQPRSLTVHFLRPPHAGPVVVRPAVERAGRTLSTVTARLEQDDRPIALALGAFSNAWESPLLPDGPMPEVEPPDAARPPMDSLRGDRPRPAFTERLTMQHRFGDRPFSSAARGLVGGWLGLREARPIDALTVAVLSDAWFPAPWPRLAELAPAPTVELTVHFRAPLPLPDGLLLGRFGNRLVRDGFFDEDGELWAQDGTLVAMSRQLGLLIGARA
ncbi:MAG TPA: thioesterase family protein [Solirubrobacteraceae bacterium]|nr:thioesterase family protein [Solirubrobacteraceae bacterium]